MASLFTSVYPGGHGVKHGIAMDGAIHGQELLDDSFLTLAEVLRSRGYKTFGISSNAHMSRDTGMAQGFDNFTSFWFYESAPVHQAAVELTEQIEEAKPWFLWIHYFDPHSPYQPRKPWIDSYAKHPEYIDEFGNKHIEWLREQQPRIEGNRDILQTLIDLYDSEINYTDDFVRRLFSEVLPPGNTLIVISADHGEAFLDHGFLGHAKTLFQEEIRVPLIIVPPGATTAQSRRSGHEVSIIDIYPTILDYAGIKPPTQCRGRSLRSVVEGGIPEPGRPVFAEFDRGVPQQSVILDGWKLTVCGTEQARVLANLAADPGETQNLASSELAMTKRLNDEMERWRAHTPLFTAPRGEVRLTPKQEELMKSLGYLR